MASTRPNAITASLLQPIPGTVALDQVKSQLLHDVAEMGIHYWFGTEFFKHPMFELEDLRAARQRLIDIHVAATSSLQAQLTRKAERRRVLTTRHWQSSHSRIRPRHRPPI